MDNTSSQIQTVHSLILPTRDNKHRRADSQRVLRERRTGDNSQLTFSFPRAGNLLPVVAIKAATWWRRNRAVFLHPRLKWVTGHKRRACAKQNSRLVCCGLRTNYYFIIIIIIIIIIFSGTAAQRGLWPPRPRSFLVTLNDAPHSVGLGSSSGRVISSSHRPLPDNTHNRQTYMPLVGF
jgi:hypothetical protein